MELKYKQEYTSDKERINFVVEYNHKQGYEIRYSEETAEVEKTREIPVFENVLEKREQIVLDDEGQPILNGDGEFQYENVDIEVLKPVMIEEKYEESVPVLDDEGNPTGEVTTVTKTREIQKTQTETYTDSVIHKFIEAWGDSEEEALLKAKEAKLSENTQKAKQAIENGYVTFKEAQFETNAQTVGDLTATMLMLQAASEQGANGGADEDDSNFCHLELVSESDEDEILKQVQDDNSNVQNDNSTYYWLSKDDKVVELNLQDFIALGGLIAEYKNTVWNNKYVAFKSAIEKAETLEELNLIEIDYEVLDEAYQ